MFLLRRAILPTRTLTIRSFSSYLDSAPSPSIWRRKKEMGKEGIFVVQQLKRLAAPPSSSAAAGSAGAARMDQFMRSHVARLVRTDLLAVLAEFQRQDLVFLSMKIYDVVRKEIWYRPDMYFYRDMLYLLARNKKLAESRKVWSDLKTENVKIDQHTYGDIVRAFCDGGLVDFAMEIYEEMRNSSDLPISLPFRVILRGLVEYKDLREKVKKDFLDLFPHMVVYDDPVEDDLYDGDEKI
ncbi:hypothetical protein LUZ60_013111 [Juncus effusus]|nr:hypothetical protein LUZ60_013111 [Juncus effusus]